LLGLGGAIPLAPTKHTNLAVELENRRQRSVESEVDCIRRELVFEPLEPQDVERAKAAITVSRRLRRV